MKKHLLAAAVATAIAAPAMAQVTVYGNLDLGHGYLNVKNAAGTDGDNFKISGVRASRYASSRLGFKAEEDLGGGLKAMAVQEFALTAGTVGTGANSGNTNVLPSNRTSVIGLSGSFGSIKLGRDKTQSQLIAEGYDAAGAVNAIGNLILSDNSETIDSESLTADFGGVIKARTGDRQDGMISYSSPTFSGFQVHVDYVNNANSQDDGDSLTANSKVNYIGLRADYMVGNLAISAGTVTEKNRATDATATTKDSSKIVGVKYKMGATELFGQWASGETKDTAGAQSSADTATNVGIAHTIDGNRFFVQMGQGETESTAGVKTFDRDSVGAGVTRSLSKRTTIYALYGEVKSKAPNATLEQTGTEFVIGLNHKF